ncbi:MAG: hypothetical protein E7287_05140 [Lachnospiraceae bacterium]|nr:hypothetical protein [Lachnospiraceae bacterium]
MERITYRITLDTFKSGVQRRLQGFCTSDNMARRIAVNLVSGGDTYEIPLDHVTAAMYVTTPGAKEPSINECTIEDNTIVYDVLPITEPGITRMQVKVIETSETGARKVLLAPTFTVEVAADEVSDKSAEQSTTFTALENAVAMAKEVYDSRVLRVEIEEDCTFRVYYADGTVYENDYFHEALYNGNAILAESFAMGGTGAREGEDTDNAKYYAAVSKSASADVDKTASDAKAILEEAMLKTLFTVFGVDWENGHLTYLTTEYEFEVDKETGELVAKGEGYTPESVISSVVNSIIDDKLAAMEKRIIEELAIKYAASSNQIMTLVNGEWIPYEETVVEDATTGEETDVEEEE